MTDHCFKTLESTITVTFPFAIRCDGRCFTTLLRQMKQTTHDYSMSIRLPTADEEVWERLLNPIDSPETMAVLIARDDVFSDL